MRKLITFLIALASIAFGVCSPALAAQALDGANQNNVNTGVTGTGLIPVVLTTTSSNDVIIVCAFGSSSGSTSFSVSGAGLSSVAQRGTDQIGPDTNRFACFKAIAASPLSAVTITVTVNGWGGFGFFSAIAFGISGSDTTTVFDSNGSLPAFASTLGGSPASGTTSNANDFIYNVYDDGVGTAGTGWNQILTTAGGFSAQYKVVSSAGAQTGSLNPNNVNTNSGILDAVIQSSGGGSPACTGKLMLMGVGC